MSVPRRKEGRPVAVEFLVWQRDRDPDGLDQRTATAAANPIDRQDGKKTEEKKIYAVAATPSLHKETEENTQKERIEAPTDLMDIQSTTCNRKRKRTDPADTLVGPVESNQRLCVSERGDDRLVPAPSLTLTDLPPEIVAMILDRVAPINLADAVDALGASAPPLSKTQRETIDRPREVERLFRLYYPHYPHYGKYGCQLEGHARYVVDVLGALRDDAPDYSARVCIALGLGWPDLAEAVYRRAVDHFGTAAAGVLAPQEAAEAQNEFMHGDHIYDAFQTPKRVLGCPVPPASVHAAMPPYGPDVRADAVAWLADTRTQHARITRVGVEWEHTSDERQDELGALYGLNPPKAALTDAAMTLVADALAGCPGIPTRTFVPILSMYRRTHLAPAVTAAVRSARENVAPYDVERAVHTAVVRWLVSNPRHGIAHDAVRCLAEACDLDAVDRSMAATIDALADRQTENGGARDDAVPDDRVLIRWLHTAVDRGRALTAAALYRLACARDPDARRCRCDPSLLPLPDCWWGNARRQRGYCRVDRTSPSHRRAVDFIGREVPCLWARSTAVIHSLESVELYESCGLQVHLPYRVYKDVLWRREAVVWRSRALTWLGDPRMVWPHKLALRAAERGDAEVLAILAAGRAGVDKKGITPREAKYDRARLWRKGPAPRCLALAASILIALGPSTDGVAFCIRHGLDVPGRGEAVSAALEYALFAGKKTLLVRLASRWPRHAAATVSERVAHLGMDFKQARAAAAAVPGCLASAASAIMPPDVATAEGVDECARVLGVRFDADYVYACAKGRRLGPLHWLLVRLRVPCDHEKLAAALGLDDDGDGAGPLASNDARPTLQVVSRWWENTRALL